MTCVNLRHNYRQDLYEVTFCLAEISFGKTHSRICVKIDSEADTACIEQEVWEHFNLYIEEIQP